MRRINNNEKAVNPLILFTPFLIKILRETLDAT